MTTIVIKAYEKLGQLPGLQYDQSGKILNPVSRIKMSEFHFMNKFIRRYGVMNFAKVEFEDAYTSINGKSTALPVEKVDELRQALADKLENKAPVPEKSALELRNEELMARIERLEAREISNDVPKVPAKPRAPKQTKKQE